MAPDGGQDWKYQERIPLPEEMMRDTLTALDFFSGSGLVTAGLSPFFEVVWANDNDERKNAIYRANFGDKELHPCSICDISGKNVPKADLAWASFPCQDLSLAGNLKGINGGTRSSLFWEWMRVMDEMPEMSRPPVLAIENVVGFLISHECKNFIEAYTALRKRGYVVGGLVMDAAHFLPQSRPRSFIVAAREGLDLSGLASGGPIRDLFHTNAVMRAFHAVNDEKWVWWKLPVPTARPPKLKEICEFDAEVDPSQKTQYLLSMLSERNQNKLHEALSLRKTLVGTGYKRIRQEADGKKQRLEIRFDGVAGCLRTPNGGSSRQILLIVKEGQVRTRLMTVRETARLMGISDDYHLPQSYNDGYRAMGDAVAVPVTAWLAKHLLAKLAGISKDAEGSC